MSDNRSPLFYSRKVDGGSGDCIALKALPPGAEAGSGHVVVRKGSPLRQLGMLLPLTTGHSQFPSTPKSTVSPTCTRSSQTAPANTGSCTTNTARIPSASKCYATLDSRKLATRDFEMDHVGQTYPRRDFESAWDYKTRNWID